MKKRKFLSAALAAMLAASTPLAAAVNTALSVTAIAANTQTSGDWEYKMNEDGETVRIIKYNGSDTDIEFPATLDEKVVTIIGAIKDYGEDRDDYPVVADTVTSVKIPNGVTTIGFHAFDKCTSLTSVTMPDSVTSIIAFAFSGCTSLTSVTIPENTKMIGYYAFAFCKSLESVTISEGITKIVDVAFTGCTSLKNVTFNGTKEKWDAIDIMDGNECLTDAKITFTPTESASTESTLTPGSTDPVSEPENSSDSSTDEPTVLEATLKNVDSEKGIEGASLDKLLFSDNGWTWEQVEKIVFTSDSLFSVQYTAVDGTTKTLGEKPAQRAEDEGIWNTEWTLDTSLMSKDNSFVKLIAKEGTADIKATIYIKKGAEKPSTGGDQANTGIALAIAPIALAASAVIVASKKKK